MSHEEKDVSKRYKYGSLKKHAVRHNVMYRIFLSPPKFISEALIPRVLILCCNAIRRDLALHEIDAVRTAVLVIRTRRETR